MKKGRCKNPAGVLARLMPPAEVCTRENRLSEKEGAAAFYRTKMAFIKSFIDLVLVLHHFKEAPLQGKEERV